MVMAINIYGFQSQEGTWVLTGSLLFASFLNTAAVFQCSGCQLLSWEDLLEEGMATHPSILAWEIPWTEDPGGLKPMGSLQSQDMT